MAALDPAGGGRAGDAARAHAAGCDTCHAAIAAARTDTREVAALLSALDHPVPAVNVAQLLARAGTRQPPAPTGAERARARHVPHWSRWGVGLAMLGTAAVAAAVVPQSPVRAFLQRVLTSHQRTTPAGPTVPPGVAPRGVAIIPAGTIDIIFHTPPRGTIHIVADTGPRVAVQASGANVTYAVGQDTIVVSDTGAVPGDYTVRLPSPARLSTARVFAGGRRVYARIPGRTESSGTPRENGGYDIPLLP